MLQSIKSKRPNMFVMAILVRMSIFVTFIGIFLQLGAILCSFTVQFGAFSRYLLIRAKKTEHTWLNEMAIQ